VIFSKSIHFYGELIVFSSAQQCKAQVLQISRIFSIKTKLTRGVSHCGHAIYNKKYLKAKEELWKLKYFTMQKYNLQKSCTNQNPSRYYNFIMNIKFQYKPKYHILQILISK
jgi:hypothetical protein